MIRKNVKKMNRKICKIEIKNFDKNDQKNSIKIIRKNLKK